MPVLTNIEVYGLENSVKASKYPMSTDITSLSDEITPNVVKLGQALAGSGHDNYLNGIVVQFDLTFSVKAWTEAERYHFLDFVSSQSTMHRITRFDLNKAYIEYVDPRIVAIMRQKIDDYNTLLESEDDDPDLLSRKYLEILYSNPCGFKLTARMTTNYRQLKTIYYQRRYHRLPEWHEFCEEIKTLPHFTELCLKEENDENKTD